MGDNKIEKYLINSPEPVSIKGMKNILYQMNNCICKIYNKGEGNGFFTKIPFKSKLLPVLITNSHLIGVNDIKNNKAITIYINNDQKLKTINIDKSRLRYTNEKLDITIIEINEMKDNLNNNYLELDENVLNYAKEVQKIKPLFLNDYYSNKSIYIPNYQKEKDIVVSYGKSPLINKDKIKHYCKTKDGSSGSPILLINNQKLIGIHWGNSNQHEFNLGTLILNPIKELNQAKYKLIIIDKEGKLINVEEKINNYIIAEFDVKKDNQNIRIINSYEKCNEEFQFWKYYKEYENEKEIKEKCEIKINNKKIPFSYFHKFDKKGNYTIKYTFKKYMIKLDYIFYGCSSLISLNFSRFNTNNVTNMHCMFKGCSALTNLNLKNFKTNNVTDMSGMFEECKSLKELDLSKFNTDKVTELGWMFKDCSSLKNLNLSNFNTNNTINMSQMFSGCSSLTSVNLANFNMNNVSEMWNMFGKCSSLISLNLSNCKMNDDIYISDIFSDCKKLTRNSVIVHDEKIKESINNLLKDE